MLSIKDVYVLRESVDMNEILQRRISRSTASHTHIAARPPEYCSGWVH